MRLGILLLCLAALSLSALTRPGVSGSVRVTVTEEGTPINVIYRYTVTNSVQSYPLEQFFVGYDYFDGLFELKLPPKGWTFNGGLPRKSATSPNGWNVEVRTEEDVGEVMFQWSASERNRRLIGRRGFGTSTARTSPILVE